MLYQICFSQQIDWKRAYQQLSKASYERIQKYSRLIEISKKLQNINHSIKQKIQQIKSEKNIQNAIINMQSLNIQKQQKIQQKSNNQEDQNDSQFFKISDNQLQELKQALLTSHPKCPYQDCYKIYTSTVALNCHIKNKHHGGTKKQRQNYAKKYLKNRDLKKNAIKSEIILPPNFLLQFEESYKYQQMYNM